MCQLIATLNFFFGNSGQIKGGPLPSIYHFDFLTVGLQSSDSHFPEFWKLLYFERGPYKSNFAKSVEWNRGAYLVRAVVHCGECHTPRNILGGVDNSRWFMGIEKGEGLDLAELEVDHAQNNLGEVGALDLG